MGTVTTDKFARRLALAALVPEVLIGLRFVMERPHRLRGLIVVVSALIAGVCMSVDWNNKKSASSSLALSASKTDGGKPATNLSKTPEPPAVASESQPSTNTETIELQLPHEANTEAAERCIFLYEELNRNLPQFDDDKRQLAEHILARLEEIALAAGATIIRDETIFDRTRHQPDAAADNGAPIASTLSPGFAIGRRILHRAKVRIASPSKN